MLGGNRKNLILATGLGSVVLGTACRAPNARAPGWRHRPQQTLSPASPAQAAWQRRGRAVAAKSDASDGAAPNRPSAAPARAVVLTSLIQLVGVAMNLRLRHRRSLRAIERNLADSDPSLTKLFSAFTDRAPGEERGRAENVKARPLRALARRLAVNVRSHMH